MPVLRALEAVPRVINPMLACRQARCC